jgi:outer membrane protein assembly factor BamB
MYSRRPFKTAFAAIALSTAFLCPGPARGEDWPQFRGADRENRSKETGLLKEWPKGGPPMAWKAKGLGAGYSTVSVAGGKIFTMGDLPDGNSYAHAMEESDGRHLWSAKIGKAGGGQDTDPNRTGTRCTPTVDGDKLYVLGQYGDLVCLNAADGKENWRVSLTKDFGGQLQTWAYAESPLVDGNKVICTPGGREGTLLALDKATGKKLWQSKEWTGAAMYVSPVVAEIGGVRQYLQIAVKSRNECDVAGVAADNGRVLWKATFPGRTAVAASPVYHDNVVVVAAGYGVGAFGYRITQSGGNFAAEQIWESKDLKNHHGGFVRVGDVVFGSNDPRYLACLDFKTGKERWKTDETGKGSVTFADGNLVYRPENGATVHLVAADPAAYQSRGQLEQPERTGKPAWAYPVVANGKLYLRDQDNLFCYDVKAK